ncbi:MAG: flagellar basal body L-ring protein FlgH [Thermogemmata sp.]|nr:flagellar basal body L-ring protein FlgH [Thermogemmata sp.]
MFSMILYFSIYICIYTDCDSIWDRRHSRYAYLFQDNNARNIGDVLTVVISENTVIQEQDKRDLEKNSQSNANITLGNTQSSLQIIQNNSNLTFAGSANNTTNRQLSDRITVVVVDVLPNNNLVVEGYRKRVVAGEERIIYLSGVVRPADIKVGNIITSDKVANLRVYYIGRGISTSASKPGFFNRLFYKIWPW